MVERATCDMCPLGKADGGPNCPLVRTSRLPGARLYVAGDPADTLYLIVQGEALLSRPDGEGVARPRALRVTGELVGLEAINGGSYEDDAVCVARSEICAIPADRILPWLHARPRAGAAVASLAAGEARRCATERERESDGSCEQRLAAFLLERNKQPRRARIPKRTLAGLLGMRPETLSRCIRRLASRGAIDARSLSVRSTALLAKAGGVPAGDR